MTLVGSDLRSSAALVIAALISEKISYIYGLEHLDRGYENFENKLFRLGVQIERNNIGKTICGENDIGSSLKKNKTSCIKAA